MPAGEGLQSPLKAQPFSGLAASTAARCGPGIPERPRVGLLRATAEVTLLRDSPGTQPRPGRHHRRAWGFGAALNSPRYEIPAAGIPALYITLMRFKGAIGLAAAQRSASNWGGGVLFLFVSFFNV